MKRLRWFVGATLVAGAGGAVWYFLGSSVPSDVYVTVPARRGSIASSVIATGTINPVITVEVGSQISGQVASLEADFNSVVHKGQVIARLDPSNLQAQVQRDRANLASTRANLERARVEAANDRRAYERAQRLAAQELIPDSDFDSAQATSEASDAAVKTAEAAVDQAKASLTISQVNLAHATIESPVDGIVISRNVDVGQTVAASLQAPTLFTIAQDLRRMEVHMNVAESDIGRLALGQDATFTVDAYPQERFRGKISEIRNAPTTIQNVVTYEAVIGVANDDLRLKPGMTANISVVVARRDDALLVPNAALRFKPPEGIRTEPAATPAAGTGSRGPGGSTAPGAAEGQSGARPTSPGEPTGNRRPPGAAGGESEARQAERTGEAGEEAGGPQGAPAAPEGGPAGGPGAGRGGGAGGSAGGMSGEPGRGSRGAEGWRARGSHAESGAAPEAGGGRGEESGGGAGGEAGGGAATSGGGGAGERGGQPGGGGGQWTGRGRGGAGAGRVGPSVWRLTSGQPQQVPIRIGITDGSWTEVVSGDLKEGDPVITELTPAAAAAAASGQTGRPRFGRMF